MDAEPREGLPPCFVRYAQFEKRVAIVHSDDKCHRPGYWSENDVVITGTTIDWDSTPDHPMDWESCNWTHLPLAEWEKAEHFVRTGELE